MSTAVVFPGQGSQAAHAGRPWADHPAFALVDEAEAVTGRPLRHLLLDATAEELAPTREAQLSVLVLSLVAWRALEPTLDAPPVAVAGHSLGQVTALVAAGVLDLDAGLGLAVARADATTGAQARTPGGLVALLGADEAIAARACEATPGRAWVANVNGAGQVVVGGHLDALGAVAERALTLGARRARRLAVGGAFHTPLMAPAADELAPILDRLPFAEARVPVVTNHDARVATGPGWPDRLATHLVAPVRWAATVEQLVALGADTVIEVGPGSTLAGLVRRIAPELSLRSVATPGDLPVAARS